MVVEMIATGIQVTGGILLGVTEAHLEQEVLQDIEAEEVGHGQYRGAHPTGLAVTAAAEVQFAAVLQLKHINLACLHGLSGDHFLGAGAHQDLGPPWTLNLPSE